MNSVKKFLLKLIIIGLLLLPTSVCYAHPTAGEHNDELESVLFVWGYSKYQSTEIKNYVTAIEYASYLTIDQFGGKGEEQYNMLKAWKMGGLPLRFKTIDYSEDPLGNGKKINANTHRRFTHQGWDREYEIQGVKKFWNNRRNVLLGTVNTIFDLKKLSSITGYSDTCNSLCGIIYYVHILGDHIEADNYNKISLLIDLAGHSGTDKNDIITALREYIRILFKDQENASDYKDLMKGLDRIEKNAGKLVRSVGGVNTEEEFQEYHQYAEELLALLEEHIPVLLKQEEFFKTVFYPS